MSGTDIAPRIPSTQNATSVGRRGVYFFIVLMTRNHFIVLSSNNPIVSF